MAETFTDRMRQIKQLMNDLDQDLNEDTQLLDQVESLCTTEKSFSYWASVAFGVKPRDVLRKILHEAQRQAAESSGRTHERPREGEPPPSPSQGSGIGDGH